MLRVGHENRMFWEGSAYVVWVGLEISMLGPGQHTQGVGNREAGAVEIGLVIEAGSERTAGMSRHTVQGAVPIYDPRSAVGFLEGAEQEGSKEQGVSGWR